MEDKDKGYSFFLHIEWFDLLSTIDAKYKRNCVADQIKIISASKAAPDNSDSNTSAKVPHKKNESTGVLPA